jgi:hypothetical protein
MRHFPPAVGGLRAGAKSRRQSAVGREDSVESVIGPVPVLVL